MLEWAKAHSGQMILRRNGIVLHSLRDPQREADLWVEKQKFFNLTSVETLMVLGIANGFHLRSLQLAYPNQRIIAFDSCEMQSVVETEKNKSSKMQYMFFETISELFCNEEFLKALQKSYVVLRHPSSMQSSGGVLNSLDRFLVHRSKDEFQRFCHITGLSFDLNESLLPPSEPLSVKHLEASLSSSTNFRARSIWKVLRELVK